MLARTVSYTVVGIDGVPVDVEVDLRNGTSQYTVVGMADAAIKESKERVNSAVRNSNYNFPSRRLVVSLAPAELKKSGAQLDLAIAIGVLAASDQITPTQDRTRPTRIGFVSIDRVAMIGELALDGSLRPIWGALPMALRAAKDGLDAIIVPRANEREAAAAPIRVLPAGHLKEVIAHLTGECLISPAPAALMPPPDKRETGADMSDVRGQAFARRALEVAAAGGHNLLFIGPPGTGKSMLAKRLPGILPPMSVEEALETTRIHSVMGLLGQEQIVTERPFRAPHHTTSNIALVGGGTIPKPGEISIAHNGVLFLDELPEYRRDALEALRQPLENGRISVSRAAGRATYPARFLLAAAMNPCPCGYSGHPTRSCICAPTQARKYLSRISGPMWDRIDLHVEMGPITFDEFSTDPAKPAESSATIRERVINARAIQEKRYAGTRTFCNSRMSPRQIRKYCPLNSETSTLLERAMARFGFSARTLDRLLRVARTIADLAGTEAVAREHVVEAIQFRTLDRNSTPC